jgi:hypothetical protein
MIENEVGETHIMEEKVEDQKDPLVREFGQEEKPFFTSKLLIALVILLVLGSFSGYFLSKASGKGPLSAIKNLGNGPKSGTIVGSSDTNTFKDTTEGILQAGGIEGEGTYHLVRPGGPSQNVYLTSSVVDLSKFVNANIKVWGQTQKARHAGWLMDVGRVQVL